MTKKVKEFVETDLNEKLGRIQEKFKDSDYVLLGFEKTTAVGDSTVKHQDVGIINLNTSIDFSSVFKELVVRDKTHKLLGGNFPSLEKDQCSDKVKEAASLVESYNIPELPIKKKPATKKTEAKLEEAKKRLKSE